MSRHDDTNNAHTRFNLALAYQAWAAAASGERALPLLRLRRAREELRRAIAIQPGYTQARQLLAQVEERLRRAGG